MHNLHHQTTPQDPLRDRQILDLAHALENSTRQQIDFMALADLIARGPALDVAQQTIDGARARLQGASDRGSKVAAGVLAQLDREAA
jgi:hypothetical protein